MSKAEEIARKYIKEALETGKESDIQMYMQWAMKDYAQSQLQELREEAESLKGKRAGSQEYERGYARGLSDILNLIDQLQED